MLTKPPPEAIESIDSNNVVETYHLHKTQYCGKCNKTVKVNRMHYIGIDYWFVDYCRECSAFDRKVFKRQTMPLCERCNDHYKVENDSVVLLIFDTLGKRICSDCKQPFLKRLRERHGSKNISANSYGK